MNLTPGVLNDLLTLYLADEASPDTRALVEDHLRRDPELARQVEASRRIRLPSPPTPATPSAEKAALDETRRLLRNRTHTLVVAILFTILPLSFAFDGTGITFLLIRDAPRVGLAWWATAAAMWIAHLYYRRRLRVSGL